MTATETVAMGIKAIETVAHAKIDQRDAEIARLRSELRQARELIHRYRTETPLGYQPHMIAETADHWLLANVCALPQLARPRASCR